ncbi:hypothetical protein [Leptonema illini]|jgi:hypothetical protein|uniref:Uncharacterized protein n=1 Tax=Leptonema illini DSM 21528 TaxID=929563 RepID=H2CDP7_9LEPT|nr:hypothetical protein [Leptonema illini]EHQ07585.1 hypothetical protein Lepil_2917 [Leptonema illini DSM 21528]
MDREEFEELLGDLGRGETVEIDLMDSQNPVVQKIHEMNRALEEESRVASNILNKSLESASRAFLTR